MSKKKSASEIESEFSQRDFHVVQERNDFLLPQILDFVKKERWINTRPEYQRRLVWDNKKKSRLIESLLMNVPVPPIFLFEHDLSRYEVMDGQQRLNAVVEFYGDELRLSGLEYWKILNGLRYSELPPLLQRGIDRRRISATVLLNESGGTRDRANELRRQIFDRLNTGGQKLNQQELRNCLFAGAFNNSLVKLAANSSFNDMFGIPRYRDNIRKGIPNAKIRENQFYKRMKDVEIVLRFLTFRGPRSKISGSVKAMLDKKMIESQQYSSARIQEDVTAFEITIDSVWRTLGADAFRFPGPNGTFGDYSIPLCDAVLVAFDRLGDKRERAVKAKAKVRQAINRAVLSKSGDRGLFTGRANTAQSIRDRLAVMEKALLAVI